ncbi:unnamed protein product, partial [Sphacelaria rigidula]
MVKGRVVLKAWPLTQVGTVSRHVPGDVSQVVDGVSGNGGLDEENDIKSVVSKGNVTMIRSSALVEREFRDTVLFVYKMLCAPRRRQTVGAHGGPAFRQNRYCCGRLQRPYRPSTVGGCYG